ncbi:MAG: adenylate/guanylate cyclase domain-containing protein [Candidatus Riflebacteria bacterium]|nr:adenylate/guanylate cyclase domain-containing protein [Candidatus Riflebacteria bacterium]
MKFASFDSLNTQKKQSALMHIKDSQTKRKDDFFLVLHALIDSDSQVRLTAKLAYSVFQDESYYVDLKGLSQDELRKKVEDNFRELQGIRPELIEWDGTIEQPVMAKNLQNRLRKAELNGSWEGKYPSSAAILNTLREDTQGMISKFLLPEEEVRSAFIACFHDALKPFRETRRTLDSTTTVSVVNLSHFHFELPEYPGIQAMFSLLERPIYILVILTSKRLILFMRDQIRTSKAAVQAIHFSQIKRVQTNQTQRGSIIEIETEGDLFKIPNLLPLDGTELDRLLRELSIEAIEADESFIERDFEKEIEKLNLLYKGRTVSNSEYVFRKNRLQKMEFEKFSEKNVELLLTKRFAGDAMGKKFDEQLMKKFTMIRTIVFTDIVGYSKKAAEKMLLDTMTLLAVHDKMLMPIIEKHNGQLIKKIGDALMIKFNDALPACSAALEMQETLIKFNRGSQEKILIRIGINTGTVFEKNDDVFGDAVNVAARMESMAQPGRIFITSGTFEAVKGQIPCLDCGERTVKGQKNQLRVFALIDESKADEEMLQNAREFSKDVGIENFEEVVGTPVEVKSGSVPLQTSDYSLTTETPIDPSAAFISEANEASGNSDISNFSQETPVSISSSSARSSNAQYSENISIPDLPPQTPDQAINNMFQSLDHALNSYKTAVKLGYPRSALLERWFTAFVNEIKNNS